MNSSVASAAPPAAQTFSPPPSFNVGNKVQILPKQGPLRDLIPTSVIGCSENQFLLLKLPIAANGAPITLVEGEALSVRVFSGVSVYVFDAVTLRCELHPFYCLFLSYPSNVQTHALRDAIRVRADVECEVNMAGNAMPGTLLNLSTGGALVRIPTSDVRPETKLSLSFSLHSPFDSERHPLAVEAVIRSVKPIGGATPEGDSTAAQCGVQFVDLSDSDRLVLQNHAYEVLLTDRKRIV